MRKIILLFTIFFALTGCSGKKNYIVSAGDKNGIDYQIGNLIAKTWNEQIENMNVVTQATVGSVHNLHLLSKSDSEYAIVQNDILDYAYNGIMMFDQEPVGNISSVASLYPQIVQIAVSRKSLITSVYDLKGKHVSVGPQGSGTEMNTSQILDGYGMSFDDIKKHNYTFKEAAEKLEEGLVDAIFMISGTPDKNLKELAYTESMRLIEISGTEADCICQKYPFYTNITIPGGLYKGCNLETPSLGIRATLAVRSNLDESDVYSMTKALYENMSAISEGHPWKNKNLAESVVKGVSVPFHPGALRYYQEIGLVN